MTTYQKAANVLVAVRRETTPYSVATVTGASQMRFIDSPGLELKRAQVQSQEKRADGLTSMMRLGYKSADGSYSCELTSGGVIDIFLEAVMRSAWVASWSAPFSSLTTVAIGTNTLTAAAGSFATLTGGGIRVGDIFQLSSTTVAGNNSLNKRVVSVATLTLITEAAAFTTLAATATGTITILKKVKTATTPTQYTHSIEQNDTTIDLSEVFIGGVVVGAKMSFRPGAPATVQWTIMATDRQLLTTGTSPYFTSPTVTTGLALIADDSTIHFNGTQVATFTGFDLDFQITAKGEPVIGSLVTPAIFDNDMNVTGTITGLRSDFSNPILFDAETEVEINIKLEEPATTLPKNCLNIFMPRVKISSLSAPVGGGDGAKIETLGIQAGPKASNSSFYDTGVCTFSSSAP
jgi:hypothetical protein